MNTFITNIKKNNKIPLITQVNNNLNLNSNKKVLKLTKTLI